jgi:NADPH-dependent curcumin reductase CurA
LSISTPPARAQEVHLASRPAGDLTSEHFKTVEVEVGTPSDGQVLGRNDWMLLAVAMRELMAMEPNPDIPMPTYEVGEAPWGLTVGTVVVSESPDLAVGDLVFHLRGWREYALGDAVEFSKLDDELFPSGKYYLTQGPTAYRGMVEVAEVGEGDTVFVSGAAGGVGSLAGLIAKARGAKKVIGSAGSQRKVDYLVGELGFDAAFDYNDGPVIESLAKHAPEGVDVFFDNVGGSQFEAALRLAAPNARFALCGLLSGQNPTLDFGPIIGGDVTVRGFTTSYQVEDTVKWNQQFAEWLKDGRIAFPHTVVEGGPEAAPTALIGLTKGEFTGQVLVKLSR